jgi:hypothetical protein
MGRALKAIFILIALFRFVPLNGQVTTAQYNNARTGTNSREHILNPRNVNSEAFGRLFSFVVDGDIYAQPLYMENVVMSDGRSRNVIFVVTEHDSVYAFDADRYKDMPLWHAGLADVDLDVIPVPEEDVRCNALGPEIGITSTPVIDKDSGTLYLVARMEIDANSSKPQFSQKLYALDIRDGKAKFGSPILIKASVPLRSSIEPAGDRTNQIEFDPLTENQRAGLLLVQGKLYIAWGSLCDVGPYYGWIMAYDALTLTQVGVINTAPTSGKAGVWQSGTGLASDDQGNVFAITGDGKFDATSGDFGDTVLKIAFERGRLSVMDYFTPTDQEHLAEGDLDFGSGGPVLLSDAHNMQTEVVASGKTGTIFVLNTTMMGHFGKGPSNSLGSIRGIGECFSAPAFWNKRLYFVFAHGYLTEFLMQDGRLSKVPISQGHKKFDFPGATPVVSSNGLTNGIVWVVESRKGGEHNVPAILRAFDAVDVGRELYDSENNSERDRLPPATRFTIPTVAGGHVYVGTRSSLVVYGLLGR